MPPGRRPTPTATKLLAGNPGHRSINANEPKFAALVPSCPDHLSKGAKAEWARVSAELAGAGLLTTVDRAALAAYCTAYARWVDAEADIAEFGLVFKSPKSGYPIPNPHIGIANTSLDIMRKFLVEFGMTPSARSRIHVDHSGGGSTDPFTEFMGSIGAMDEPEDTHEDIEADQLRTDSD